VPELYTCGIWTVLPGSEEEFVSAWSDLAEWTAEHVAGAGFATLVQDEERPNRFLSFGPWESAEAIEAWRSSTGFRERVERMRELLERFEPGTFRRRAGIGAG
jgi:heme-degrading monooxygenase HmoA